MDTYNLNDLKDIEELKTDEKPKNMAWITAIMIPVLYVIGLSDVMAYAGVGGMAVLLYIRTG